MSLSPEDHRYLLELAREAITRATHRQESPPVDLNAVSGEVRRDGASFVTLTKHGELRGCIGSLEPRRPLALDVRENAVAAAFNDPRFPPLHLSDLDDLCVEVSPGDELAGRDPQLECAVEELMKQFPPEEQKEENSGK